MEGFFNIEPMFKIIVSVILTELLDCNLKRGPFAHYNTDNL